MVTLAQSVTEKFPQVSIIIPLYNRWAYTRKCLESIFALNQTDLELILVDNNSTDETPAEIDQFVRSFGNKLHFQYIRNEKNVGFAAANNQGVALARAKYVLLLNNDTEVFPGAISSLVECLESEPESGAVGARLLYPNGTIQHVGMVFGENSHWFHVLRGLPKEAPWALQRRDFQAVTAAAMLLRRADFQRVDGFDEAYRNGYEDVDLCIKLRTQLGLRVIYEPKAVFTHHESVSEGRHDRESENRKLFLAKWEHQAIMDAGPYLNQLKEVLEREMLGQPERSLEYSLRAAYRQYIFAELRQMELERRCDGLTGQLQAAQAHIQVTQAHVQMVQAHTDAILASRTYRLGAFILWPIRYFRDYLRRVRKEL